MIDKTKEAESTLAASLKTAIENCLLFEITPINFDDEIKNLNKMLRDPNMSFDSIKKKKKMSKL